MSDMLYFSSRTPCMDDPQMFDREIDDETPAESNKRMAQAARLCKEACPEMSVCRAKYAAAADRPPGVVAGLYSKRYHPKRVAVGGKYKEGDPCQRCGLPMIVDPEVPIPEGWVMRVQANRCGECEIERIARKRRLAKS